jgi:penicillin-binding protein 1A
MKGNSDNKKYLIWFWAIFSFPIIIIITLFILISKGKLGPMPSFAELENPEYYLAAQVISEDGVLLGKISIENRTWTEYKDLSPYLTGALIATEDIRYYRHSGIDIRGLGRAAVRTIMMGQSTGGGSTITQQLAKQLYPRDTARNSSIMRRIRLGVSKFKEWQTAVKLERSYTKEEIITMYLNKFDFSYNAIGIRSAARVYFNTTPDSLNLQQAAMLIGMLKASTKYNPLRNYNLMLQRRNVVILQMAKAGYISNSVADSVMKLPIEVVFTVEDHNSGLATYLRQYLTNLMKKPEPDRNKYERQSSYDDALWEWQNNSLYGWCTKNKKPNGTSYDIFRDGLKIYTTINSRMQKYAEEAMTEHLSREIQPAFYRRARHFRNPPYSDDIKKEEVEDLIMASLKQSHRYNIMLARGASEDSIMLAFNTRVKMRVFSWKGDRDTIMTPLDSIRYYKYFIRSSFLVEDPHNGYVKAYVGGPDFRYFKYDAVTQQKKQVGSTIKPFLYTVAMQNGYSPCYEVMDIPQSFDIPGDSMPWKPRSTGPERFHGRMVTLAWGLAESENFISAWLMKQFKPTAVTELMHKMGVRSFIDPVPSIFLGTSDIKLEEMVGAYGTFANKGVYTRPMYVTRIEDKNGNTISKFTPKIEEVLSENQAYLMINLLQGVVRNGTGNNIRREPYNLMNQIGGKTGTTQNHSNGWFMGVTPNLVGGVWCGWEDQAIHFEALGEGSGAHMALPIMAIFLKKVYADPQFGIMEADEFEVPSNFNVELDCARLKKTNSRGENSRRVRY